MSENPSRWAVWGLYLFALTLVLSPAVDLLAAVWPLAPREVNWRYSFFGLMAGVVHTPIIGLLLGLAVAFSQEHRFLLRSGGITSLIGATALVGGMGIFALDIMDVRSLAPPDMQKFMLVGGIIQEVRLFGAALVIGLLGIGAVEAAKAAGSRPLRGGEEPGIVSSSRETHPKL